MKCTIWKHQSLADGVPKFPKLVHQKLILKTKKNMKDRRYLFDNYQINHYFCVKNLSAVTTFVTKSLHCLCQSHYFGLNVGVIFFKAFVNKHFKTEL